MAYDPDWMQKAQNKVKFDLTIKGYKDWKSAFKSKTTKIRPEFVKSFGGAEVPTLKFLKRDGELQGASFERCLMNELINSGYVLEELEVQFLNEDEKKWGICVWYRDHKSYRKPLRDFKANDPRLAQSFLNARFKTEKAGDQTYTLLSTVNSETPSASD